MLYAILAYHVEDVVLSWSDEEDKALMGSLDQVHERLEKAKNLGPAARLDATATACTLRGGIVTDGPFAETKEQLLGFYVVDCATRDEAVAAARDLQRVNKTAVYEIRPVRHYLPGTAISEAG